MRRYIRSAMALPTIALTMSIFVTQAQANLIMNGRFDTPDLINPPFCYITFNTAPPGFGWTIVSDGRPWPPATTGFLGVDLIDCTWVGTGGTSNPDGFDQSVDIDGVSSISQSFPTVVGQKYVVEFAYSHNFGSVSSTGFLTVEGNTSLITETLVHDIPNNRVNMQWLRYSGSFLADSATTTLTIQGDFANDAAGFAVDDVSVVAEGCGPPFGLGLVQWKVEDGGNGHFYEAVKACEGIDWTAANAAAEARGPNAHLATITSQEENDFVFSLVSGDPELWNCCYAGNSAGPWLGGIKVGPNIDDYAWVTGEPFDYTNWGPFEPFGNGERIGFFGYQTLIGPEWNDAGPGFPAFGYIVEISDAPLCDIELTQTVYTAGETVTAENLQLGNPSPTDSLAVELKVWFEFPDGGKQSLVNVGADGSFVWPPGFDWQFGPFPLLPVFADTALGPYGVNCRVLDPVSGKTLSLDENRFDIR